MHTPIKAGVWVVMSGAVCAVPVNDHLPDEEAVRRRGLKRQMRSERQSIAASYWHSIKNFCRFVRPSSRAAQHSPLAAEASGQWLSRARRHSCDKVRARFLPAAAESLTGGVCGQSISLVARRIVLGVAFLHGFFLLARGRSQRRCGRGGRSRKTVSATCRRGRQSD